MKPFQYLIIWTPTEKEIESGKKAKIIVEGKWLLAPDEKTVGLLAGHEVPEEYLNSLEQLQVLIRPF